MNRHARLRLRGLSALADAARGATPIAGRSGVIDRRELCDVPVSRAGATDGVGVAIDPVTTAPGVADEPDASGELAPDDVLVGGPMNGETVGARAANRDRALRALRTARARRLAIALAMTPGTGVE
jgi:hypothetical protein